MKIVTQEIKQNYIQKDFRVINCEEGIKFLRYE